MKISDIYEKYKIMPNLQEHMLRVAGVASLICDNFEKSINKNSIISACLLHDMGGMSKVKLDLFPEQLKKEGVKYWEGIQTEFIEKYGHLEHEALYKIIEELGVNEEITSLIKGFGFANIPKIFKSNNIQIKICEYSDMRVSPQGVVKLKKRLREAMTRYLKKQKGIYNKEQFETNIPTMEEIEKQIFKHCKIKPTQITEKKVKPLVNNLKKFEIKTV